VLRQTLNYAGDARILDLQPNEERQLSSAVGLGTEVESEVAADSGRLTQVKVVRACSTPPRSSARRRPTR
jgi:hypothetical protein